MENIDQNKKKKILQAINLVEELSWLLDSKRSVNFKEIVPLLRSLLETKTSLPDSERFSSPNPNKNYLIGVLPNLFQDEELFKTNIELIDFATNILKIPLSKSSKRSRYEYIGLIVCEVTNLNESDLTNLVSALSKLTGNNEKLKQIKEEKKKANFSWNEAIKTLSSL